MEILNNIWHTLTTPNETITLLITSPCMFIENYLYFLIFTTTLDIEYTKTQRNIYILFIPILGFINTLFVSNPFNVFINYAIIFIFIKLLLKISTIKSILAVAIPFAIFGLVNTLIMNPFLKFFNVTIETTSTVPIYKLMYLFFVYMIIFFIIILMKSKNLIFHLQNDLDKNTYNIIFANLSLGILTLCIQALLTYYYINIVPILITLFNFALLFSYFFLSFYSLTKEMKLNIATRNLENAESYNTSLTVLYDNVRTFKHDLDNMIDIMDGFIKANDIKGLEEYYNSLRKDCVKVNNVKLLNPNMINNPGIYNLIVSKYQKATSQKVKINFEIFFDFNDLHMPIYEFSKILGILLDNAIEAAKDCEDKQLYLIFRESPKNHAQIVIIENTYSDKNVDTNKIFEKGFSGKENHTGIGLWEVNKIINSNNNTVLHTTKDDKFFKQQLEIYY